MSTSKLIEIKNALNTKFVEREEQVEALLLAIIARQHLLLIGQAGTAKSALISELAKIIQGSNYFQWLLTKFTTPEELFGVLSLKDLENGVYKRNTTHKLPEAHFTFLDEIFKSNSAILNSLLTAINERIYYNNGGIVDIPLLTVVGASNEYPEDEGLEALFDRFLIRLEVEYIQDDSNFEKMLLQSGNIQMPSLTLDELQQIQFFSDMVQIPQDVIERLITIRSELKKEGIHPSDRRYKQCLSLLRAKAILEQRNIVQISDLVILKDSLWDVPENRKMTADIVKANSLDTIQRAIDQFTKETIEILDNYKNNPKGLDTTDLALETNKKLKLIADEINSLEARHPNRAGEFNNVKEKVEKARKEIASLIINI